ncbi:hypothetical protein M427DRAFT_233566 [Gonapodya prolifera JEL478]|uniref:Uncharacterized protein n=1 Tax=Gonapodya prolifera (strain JEL478) TaxID=1344416 RepID=A0A138ZY04_GONPJ|nr:hypothetical protein M427DRAFT_233566 [Gonapodya prolifera JEL478]|eukprot:KXS09376.1 hypothetical protein M427DRAFT_233566 [Gonapodya prolifera JEL478]
MSLRPSSSARFSIQADDDINFDSDSDGPANMQNSQLSEDGPDTDQDEETARQGFVRTTESPSAIPLHESGRVDSLKLGKEGPAEGDTSNVVQPIPIHVRNHPHSKSEPGVKVAPPASMPAFGPADVQNPSVYFQLAPDPSAISRSPYLKDLYANMDSASVPSSATSSPNSRRHRPLVSELPVQYGSSVLKTSIGRISLPYYPNEMIARRNQIRAASEHGSEAGSRANSFKSYEGSVTHSRVGSGTIASNLSSSVQRAHANSDPSYYAKLWGGLDPAAPARDDTMGHAELPPAPSRSVSPLAAPTIQPTPDRIESPPYEHLPPPVSTPSPARQDETPPPEQESEPRGAQSKSPNVSYLSQKLSLEKPVGVSSPALSPLSFDGTSPLLGPTKKTPIPIIAEDTRLVVVMVGLPGELIDLL